MGERLKYGAAAEAMISALLDRSCKTIVVLQAELALSYRQVQRAAALLIVNGLAQRVEAGCFSITDAGVAACEKGLSLIARGPNKRVRFVRALTFQQRLWTAMCMSSTFTIGDIVIAAARSETNPEHLARRYVSHLRAAGYVEEMAGRAKGTKPSSVGFKRFRLVKNTGPRAPAHRSKRDALHDYNIGKDVQCARNH